MFQLKKPWFWKSKRGQDQEADNIRLVNMMKERGDEEIMELIEGASSLALMVTSIALTKSATHVNFPSVGNLAVPANFYPLEVVASEKQCATCARTTFF